MKTERRTVYVAEDGEEFSDRAECLQYEANGCVELEPLPDYGDHRPLSDAAALRWALYGDGSGYYATATQYSQVPVQKSGHPAWATHIIYFGK